jgi:hypothetical protein
LRQVPGTRAATILMESHVSHMMERILNGPMRPGSCQ